MKMGFLSRSVMVDRIEYAYQVYVPPEYSSTVPLPVILALHGGRERGRDGLRQTEVGLGTVLRQYPDRYPAIVVFPQVPEGETWQGLGATIALLSLDQTLVEFSIDGSRVYLTGLSMGGNGAWYLAYHHPVRFAAVVVICGWVSERQGRSGVGFPAIGREDVADRFAEVAQRVKELPIWIFHGETDPVVPVVESREIAAALQAIGADVHYTEFPGMGHLVWDEAYGMKAFSDWLFQQQHR
jgi:predicted peptidase